MDQNWINYWMNLKPTENRPLVHQDDPKELDNALYKTAVGGINAALPIAMGAISGPMTSTNMLPAVMEAGRGLQTDKIALIDQANTAFNEYRKRLEMLRDQQTFHPMQKFKEILMNLHK